MSLHTLTAPRAPRAAFGKIVLNEARLAWRQPAGIVVGIGLSLLLLVIFGSIPVFQQTSASLGGLSAFEVYIPILIAFSIGVLALAYLPGPLVSYREQGILRRLSTTPVPAFWVLAAQFVVQAVPDADRGVPAHRRERRRYGRYRAEEPGRPGAGARAVHRRAVRDRPVDRGGGPDLGRRPRHHGPGLLSR